MTSEAQSYDPQTGEVVNGTIIRMPQQPPVDLLAIIEKRNTLLERILDYAIKATHSEQWFAIGDKPWPTGPACEAMARRCGVAIENVSKVKRESSDDKGDFYIWEVTGTASLPSGFDRIECFGTCSSRDSFLGTETAQGRLLSEIDEGNVMKAAFTNMEVNAITRLLGIRNLSWERLEKAGIPRASVGKVTFNSGSKGGGQGGARSEGSDIMLKFGPGKNKTVGEQTDAHLVTYVELLEKDLQNPEKAQYKRNTEKQLAAVKGEQAMRANKAAGAPTSTGSSAPGVWARLKQLAAGAGVTEARLKELAKDHAQGGPVKPAEMTEADFTAIATRVAAEPKKAAAGEEDF